MKKITIFTIALTAILFTSCTKSVDTTNNTPTCYIGQSYGGGVIFYIDETGQHGLIASTNDQSNNCVWSPTIPNLLLPNNIGYGKSNTISIVNVFGNSYYAASYCTSYNGFGFNDWYLPSLNELDLMYKNNYSIGYFNTTKPSYYWSSTTSTSGKYAFVEDFSSGVQYSHDPLRNNASVRAIRSF
jgi:hypothetical protein